jgi:hypothetical protein
VFSGLFQGVRFCGCPSRAFGVANELTFPMTVKPVLALVIAMDDTSVRGHVLGLVTASTKTQNWAGEVGHPYPLLVRSWSPLPPHRKRLDRLLNTSMTKPSHRSLPCNSASMPRRCSLKKAQEAWAFSTPFSLAMRASSTPSTLEERLQLYKPRSREQSLSL